MLCRGELTWSKDDTKENRVASSKGKGRAKKAVYERKRRASLKDLCTEDRMRVKQLVEKLAQMGMEKDQLHTKLIKERCKYEETLLFLQQEHQRVLKERSYLDHIQNSTHMQSIQLSSDNEHNACGRSPLQSVPMTVAPEMGCPAQPIPLRIGLRKKENPVQITCNATRDSPCQKPKSAIYTSRPSAKFELYSQPSVANSVFTSFRNTRSSPRSSSPVVKSSSQLYAPLEGCGGTHPGPNCPTSEPHLNVSSQGTVTMSSNEDILLSSSSTLNAGYEKRGLEPPTSFTFLTTDTSTQTVSTVATQTDITSPQSYSYHSSSRDGDHAFVHQPFIPPQARVVGRDVATSPVYHQGLPYSSQAQGIEAMFGGVPYMASTFKVTPVRKVAKHSSKQVSSTESQERQPEKPVTVLMPLHSPNEDSLRSHSNRADATHNGDHDALKAIALKHTSNILNTTQKGPHHKEGEPEDTSDTESVPSDSSDLITALNSSSIHAISSMTVPHEVFGPQKHQSLRDVKGTSKENTQDEETLIEELFFL